MNRLKSDLKWFAGLPQVFSNVFLILRGTLSGCCGSLNNIIDSGADVFSTFTKEMY